VHPLFAGPRRYVMLAATGCALAATALPAAARAASPCAAGRHTPAALSDKALTAATLCLLNRQRAAHHLRALRLDHRLTTAARRHSADMVAHRYFAHDSRSGSAFTARIASTGWMRNRHRWTVGENLAWGSARRATPAAIVRAWMHSAGHRANLLSARFHVIGIGIVRGTPAGRRSGATYTTDFGS
jgi:uncharacterized protein YkwD